MKLTDKHCGLCKQELTVNDDIVVCPECGEAYHRDCYNKNGKCINEDIHEQLKIEEAEKLKNQELEKTQEETNPKKICIYCKTKVDFKTLKCPNCGESMFIAEEQVNPANIEAILGVSPNYEFDNNIKGKDIINFTFINNPYYLNVFKRIKENNKSRMNFSAFLFGGGWFFYRKQFLSGLIAFIVTLAIIISWFFLSGDVYNFLQQAFLTVTDKQMSYYMDHTTELIDVMPSIINSLNNTQIVKLLLNEAMPFLIFLVHLICGLTANKVYYKNIIKKTKKIKENHKDEAMQLSAYKAEGGVSLTYFLWYMMIVMASFLIFL